MQTLDEILAQATAEHWAVPHFNFSTIEQLVAIADACGERTSPVMVGTSEGEAKFIGLRRAVALVREFRDEGLGIWLNADHTHSVEWARLAIDAGYDSVHIDLSKLPLEENIAGTREVVDYAQKSDRTVSIEGEVGYLPTDSSKVYREAVTVDPALFTKPEDAERFVRETGVNRFAAAVGNLHGIAANAPNLDIGLIDEIRFRIPASVALVLHGGSGTDKASIKRAIESGMANVHISTELRAAWKEAISESFSRNSDEYAPYKLLAPAAEAVKNLVLRKIEEFGSVGRLKQ